MRLTKEEIEYLLEILPLTSEVAASYQPIVTNITKKLKLAKYYAK